MHSRTGLTQSANSVRERLDSRRLWVLTTDQAGIWNIIHADIPPLPSTHHTFNLGRDHNPTRPPTPFEMTPNRSRNSKLLLLKNSTYDTRDSSKLEPQRKLNLPGCVAGRELR